MRRLLKTPGRFCDIFVLFWSPRLHLDELYLTSGLGNKNSTLVVVVAGAAILSCVTICRLRTESSRSVMVSEGRTMSIEFRAPGELVLGLAMDEGSMKQDCACDERTVRLAEGWECLAG
jgi:hypothetical protein